MDGISSDQFEDEEERVNHQQDDDPAGLGEGHGWIECDGRLGERFDTSGLAACCCVVEVKRVVVGME